MINPEEFCLNIKSIFEEKLPRNSFLVMVNDVLLSDEIKVFEGDDEKYRKKMVQVFIVKEDNKYSVKFKSYRDRGFINVTYSLVDLYDLILEHRVCPYLGLEGIKTIKIVPEFLAINVYTEDYYKAMNIYLKKGDYSAAITDQKIWKIPEDLLKRAEEDFLKYNYTANLDLMSIFFQMRKKGRLNDSEARLLCFSQYVPILAKFTNIHNVIFDKQLFNFISNTSLFWDAEVCISSTYMGGKISNLKYKAEESDEGFFVYTTLRCIRNSLGVRFKTWSPKAIKFLLNLLFGVYMDTELSEGSYIYRLVEEEDKGLPLAIDEATYNSLEGEVRTKYKAISRLSLEVSRLMVDLQIERRELPKVILTLSELDIDRLMCSYVEDEYGYKMEG